MFDVTAFFVSYGDTTLDEGFNVAFVLFKISPKVYFVGVFGTFFASFSLFLGKFFRENKNKNEPKIVDFESPNGPSPPQNPPEKVGGFDPHLSP